jgi:tRNA A37 threonylcarbamoyladenosine biosynthesis protein TsaE
MLVEWIGNVKGATPDDALLITLTVTGESTRSLEAKAEGARSEALLARWSAALG